MAKIKEAMARLFLNVYCCKKCKSKIRSTPSKILGKKVACRKCGCKSFRPIKKGK